MPPNPAAIPAIAIFGSRTPWRTHSSSASHSGTVATRRAAMPDEMRFSAIDTSPLPPRQSAVPITAALRQ